MSPALILSLLSCSTVPFDTISDLQRLYDLPPVPTALDYPEADAVVLLSTTDVELYFHGGSSGVEHGNLAGLRTDHVFHRVIRVFRNVEERSLIEINISPGDRLVSIQAQILDPVGRRTILTRADLDAGKLAAEPTGSSPNEAASERTIAKNTLRFRFPDVQPGSILEYRYRLRSDSPYLYDSWHLQEYDPVVYSHYRLTVPRDLYGPDGEEWEWRFRRYRCARVQAPRIHDSTNAAFGITTEYLWTYRDIAPLHPEPKMPPHQEYLQFVRFAHVDWSHWDAVTHWYSEHYIANALIPHSEVTAQARALIRDLRTEEERIDTLSRFVQLLEPVDGMLGEGPLTPAPPNETLEQGRGDVKDKAVLLVAMLRSVGLDANLALIVTSDRGSLDRRFPNWNFNHMLVVVNADSNPIWIDPTDRDHVPGDLPWKCEGVEAVVIGTTGGATVIETPISRHNDNRTIFDTQIVVAADSTARIDVHVQFYGEPAASAAAAVRMRGTPQFARDFALTSFGDADIQSASTVQPKRGRLNLDFSFTTAEFLDTEDVFTRLGGNPIPFGTGIELMGEESRRYPVDCNFAATWIRTWTVDFSQSPFRVTATPAAIEVENRTLRYESHFSSPAPDRIEAHQILEIRNRRVLQRNYDEARLIAADMRVGGGRGVLLQKAK